MTRGVNQVKDIFLAFQGVIHLDCMALNGNTPFSFEIHIIEQLLLHIPAGNSMRSFQQPIRQGTLAMIDMSDDTEIPNILHVVFLLNTQNY